MKIKYLILLLVVFTAAASFASGPPNQFILQVQNAGGAPIITSTSYIRLNCSTNVTCSVSGATVSITASSTASTAFSAITAGTNAGQALLIGAAGSLGTTGGGTIAATSAPWAGLTGFPTACTNQAVTGVGTSLTCTTLTSAYVDSSIAKTANPTFTGIVTTPALTISGITGSTQCLQVNSSGVVAGSGAVCGGAGNAFQANGVALTSTSTINFLNSAATNGLTLTFTNPSAGGVQLGFTGTLSNTGLANSSLTVASTSPLTGGGAVSLGSTVTLACGTCGVTGSPLSQFASTTSAQLATVLSDESGTGVVAYTISPSFTTPNIGSATASGLTMSGITGSTQCLQVSSIGVVSGTGAVCGGSGSTPGGSTTQLQYNNAGAFGGVSGWTTNGTTTMTAGATSVLDLSAMAPTAGLKLPSVAGAVPTADGFIGVNLTNHTLVYGINGATGVSAIAATGTGTSTTCSNQVVTAVSGIAVPTCTTITSAFVNSSIGLTGSALSQFASTTSAQLATVLSDESGTGVVAYTISPSFTTPNIGAATASSLTLSGITGSTQCLQVNSSGVVAGSGGTCGLGAGTTNGLAYYSSSSVITSVTPPTVNGSYLCGYVVSAGPTTVAPTCALPGIAVDATNPATLLYTDRESYIQWTSGATLTLPAAATNFASNFPFVVGNFSVSTLALTPTTPNNIDGGSAQAASNLLPNFAAFVYQDQTPNWQTVKFPMLAAFPPCADSAGNHLNFTTSAGFTCGTSSSGGGGAFSGLSGGTNTAAAMVLGTGSSLTVSGSGTNNATSVNGNSFPASAGFTSGGVAFFSSTSALGSSALLTANSPVIGGGAGTAPKTVAGLTFDGTSKLTTGVAGTSVGDFCMTNASTGTVCLAPTTGALGSAVWTFLSGTDTVVGLTSTQTLTNKTLTTAQLGSSLATTQATKTNNGTVATTAYVDAPTQLTTGTSVSLVAPRQYFVCTTTCTITVPVPAAGDEFCVMNDDNVATVITLAAIGSSARYENTARTAYGTAGTGTFISGGAVGDKVCILGRDATHYLTASFNGTWVAN